jgi:hypothetical protein
VPDGPAPAPLKKVAPDAAVRALRARGFPYARAIVALAKMVALYTGRQLLKDDVRTSDWERPLDARQRLCASLLPLRDERVCADGRGDAANDVHCAVRVCAALTRLAKDRGIALDLVKLGVTVTGAAGAETALAPETPEAEAIEEDVDVLVDADVLVEEAPAAEAPAPAPVGGRTLARTPSVSTVLQGMSLAAPAVVLSSGVSLPGPTLPAPTRPAAGPTRAAPPGVLLSAGVRAGDPQKPRHREAYALWHEGGLPLAQMYARMRTPPTLPFVSPCKVHESDSHSSTTSSGSRPD